MISITLLIIHLQSVHLTIYFHPGTPTPRRISYARSGNARAGPRKQRSPDPTCVRRRPKDAIRSFGYLLADELEEVKRDGYAAEVSL
jgi:hypothetical protein